MDKQIYLAGPLFSRAEREFNLHVAQVAIASGVSLYLPQEASGLNTEVDLTRKEIFDADIEAIDNSLAILAILDGVVVDPGTAFEMGYAYAKGIPIYTLSNDVRSFINGNQNIMISESTLSHYDGYGCIVDVLTQIRKDFDL